MEFNIPLEIKDKAAFPQLKKNDRLTVAYAVLFGVGNQDAFMRFHPEYIDGSGKQMNPAGKKASSQFWNYGKVKDYRQIYEEELAEFLGRKQTSRNVDTDIDDNRIEDALKKLLNHTIGLLDNGDNLDPDSVKTIVEVFRKMNLLKDEVEQQEAPRRYIPIRCGECAYRSFVESYVETGEIENTCLRCKALTIATEHGFRYDPKDLLRLNDEKTAE